MNPFKTYTLEWWQVSLLKTCMIAFGIALGATWPTVFAGWLPLLWIIFIVTAVYLFYVGIKQW